MLQPSSSPIPRRSLVGWLVASIAILALAASLAGLFWHGEGEEGGRTVTTYRGQTEEIYGRGIYRDSSLFAGAGAKGTDAVTLLIALPLLAAGAVLHYRGSLRGGLLLLGALAWFLYVYGSLALGAVAYNNLFLLYVALFGASLWAFILLITCVDGERFATHVSPGMPRRAPGVFLLASAVVTLAIWLMEPVSARISGDLPASLTISTTLLTNALDIAVIVPGTWVSGWLILRGRATGYLCAPPLFMLEALLAPMIIAQTIVQVRAGVDFTTAEIAGPIAGFGVLAVIALWMLVRLMRHIADGRVTPERPVDIRNAPLPTPTR
jgi:hypothetical protein